MKLGSEGNEKGMQYLQIFLLLRASHPNRAAFAVLGRDGNPLQRHVLFHPRGEEFLDGQGGIMSPGRTSVELGLAAAGLHAT